MKNFTWNDVLSFLENQSEEDLSRPVVLAFNNGFVQASSISLIGPEEDFDGGLVIDSPVQLAS